MKISVIIPVYNVRDYVEECINSVIMQSYSNIEIIIVNDGSTDGSDILCEKYLNDSRVFYVSQKNQGLSEARNTGIKIATGDFAFFLDSDDYFDKDFMSNLISFITPETDILVTGHITKTDNISNVTYSPSLAYLTGHEAMLKMLRCEIPHVAWGKLFSNKVYKKINFPSGRMCEDLSEIVTSCIYSNKVALVPINSIVYRRRSGSIMHNYNKKLIEDSIHILDDLKTSLKYNNIIALDEYDTKYLKIMISNINLSLRAKDYITAREIYLVLKNEKKRCTNYIGVSYYLAYFLIRNSYGFYIFLNELLINKLKYGIYKIK